MPISKLGQRHQVVIPKEICDALGLHEGDFVEVTSTEGQVIIKPKTLVDADDVLTRGMATIHKKFGHFVMTPERFQRLRRMIAG
jgi:AbrB family looped-hinge helix DNA binding protein